jgi:uncharacterized delta-60 repeat protein
MKANTHPAGNWLPATNNYALLFCLILTICTSVFGVEANEEWVERYNGPANGTDQAYALAVDNSGNVYVTGHSGGSGTFADYATVKYNPDGNQLWVARYNGPGNSGDNARALALDNSGNVYVTGYSTGSGTGNDYATIKYSSEDGNQLWVARYNGPGNSVDIAAALAVDNSGNVYVTGFSTGSGTGYDYATVKYGPDGNQLWVARYNGPGNDYDNARALAIDNSGNVYVTGTSTGTEYDYATVKYSPDGNQLWVARYNGPGNSTDNANDLAVDNSGNVYVTGESIGSGTNYDSTTIKYGPDGNQLWVARYNGPTNGYDDSKALAVDNSGNVYVTGECYGSSITYDYATIKYNSDGNQLWVAFYNSDANLEDTPTALKLDNYGNVYVTGTVYTSGTNRDTMTVKYAPNGEQLWAARYRGDVNGFGGPYALAVDNSSNVYVTGCGDGIGTQYDYVTIKYEQGHYFVIYVDANATGANDGSSWANAYNYLQNALWAVEPNYEIWVAQGTYKPDETTGFPDGNDSRYVAFPLKNNVALYGGFTIGGGNWASRDTNSHQTILSGDIGIDSCDIDNSYHVVTGSNTNFTAILDGFIITAGNANGSYPYNDGGGMYNSSGSPTVTNCIFSGNTAWEGGGMFNFNSSPVLTNCTFSYNSAIHSSGGGMSNSHSNSMLTNCNFIGNSASDWGGGMFNGSSSPTLNNCTFTGNSAIVGNGGGMYNFVSSPTLANCTFIDNSASYYGGGMHNENECSPALTNCAFIGNSALYYGGGIYSYHGSITLIDCNFSGNSAPISGGGMYSLIDELNLVAGTSISIADEFNINAASRVQGTGNIIIELGGEMIIDSNAVVDLNDPCDPNIKGTIQCDGLLDVKGNGKLKHATVNVSRQAGGYFGKFEVEDSAQATNLDIHTDGDRFMDVNSSTFTGTIANNRIYVTITEGQNGSDEGILEVRGLELPSHPCDFNDPNVKVCQIGSGTMPAFDTNFWTLERLEIAAGAKVTLMNRFSSGNGDPEVSYAKNLVLGAGSVLNVGVNHLFYTNLTGDFNSIVRDAQLGFSLNVIDCDSNAEFQSLVGSNNYIDPADPCLNRIQVERVTGLEPDPNGIMKMTNLEDPCSSDVIYARAKARFAPASEDKIQIQFNYLFNTSDPCAQIVVYLSDVAELLEPDDPCRPSHYIEVGRISNPSYPRPGSAGSGRFGDFDKYVDTNGLDLSQGTWVELELIEPVSGGLFARGYDKSMRSMNEDVHADASIDNWGASISCQTCWGKCRDIVFDCLVIEEDFLKVVTGTGTSNSPTCVDGVFSGDGYTDPYDTPSWDWMLHDEERKYLCEQVLLSGEGTFTASGFRALGEPGILLNLNNLNDLLISGKRGSTDNAIKMKDRLYVFNSNYDYMQYIGLEPNDRCNIRVVRGQGSDLYQVNSEKGVFRLDTGAQIVPPGQVPCDVNEPRYNLPAAVYAGVLGTDDAPYGRPVLDAAFDANFVYIVPVVVVPNSNVPYAAAAKLQLNPYRVVKLYDGNVLPNDNQREYRNTLREIELDSAGNVYVTNANKMNASDILWKFEPNGLIRRLELDPCDPCSPRVRAPAGMCVSSATNMLYIASSLCGETDPNSTVIHGFSTATLSPARTITVSGMQHVTSIAEDPVTKSLWVTGFNFNSNHAPDIFYDPYLAKVSLGNNDVNALIISDANDLAMPLSICWTGALQAPPPELCGGADLNGNGTVNMRDLAILARHWLNSNCGAPNNPCEGADLQPETSPDGDVDLLDLDILATYWLNTNCQ